MKKLITLAILVLIATIANAQYSTGAYKQQGQVYLFASKTAHIQAVKGKASLSTEIMLGLDVTGTPQGAFGGMEAFSYGIGRDTSVFAGPAYTHSLTDFGTKSFSWSHVVFAIGLKTPFNIAPWLASIKPQSAELHAIDGPQFK